MKTRYGSAGCSVFLVAWVNL